MRRERQALGNQHITAAVGGSSFFDNTAIRDSTARSDCRRRTEDNPSKGYYRLALQPGAPALLSTRASRISLVRKAISVLILLPLLGFTPAQIQADLAGTLDPDSPRPKPEYGLLVLQHENDLFAGEDRHYTSGVRAGWIAPTDAAPRPLRDLGEVIPFFPSQGDVKVSWSIGQQVYTPEDIESAVPDPNDRPYAGWLYISVGLLEESGDRLDRLQLTTGVVGPASLAEETQRRIHEWVGAPIPQGWDDQLDNEPTVMVSYERQWRSLIRTAGEGRRVDLTPHWGGALGTPFTQVNAGLTVRAGRGLPHDYGPPRIQPALPGSGLFVPRRSQGWYLFASADARAVAWNVFLDGNTWRDSASVERNPLVAEAQLGAVVGLGRARLAYTHVFRTPEFRGQRGQDDFGALSLSWIY